MRAGIAAVALLVLPVAGEERGRSSPCIVEYEHHNQVAIPKVCVAVFTEHKLVDTTESDAGGKFSLQNVPPGRYRLVAKADPLCVANVPLLVVKRQEKKTSLAGSHETARTRLLQLCRSGD